MICRERRGQGALLEAVDVYSFGKVLEDVVYWELPQLPAGRRVENLIIPVASSDDHPSPMSLLQVAVPVIPDCCNPAVHWQHD